MGKENELLKELKSLMYSNATHTFDIDPRNSNLGLSMTTTGRNSFCIDVKKKKLLKRSQELS